MTYHKSLHSGKLMPLIFAAFVFFIFCTTWAPPRNDNWFRWVTFVSLGFFPLALITLLTTNEWCMQRVTSIFKWKFFRIANSISNRSWAISAAFIMLGLACLGSHFIFNHAPAIGDEYAQVIQSQIFADGNLYAKSPRYRDFFDARFIINNGKYFAQYPPGHPLLLTIGQLLGAPWIINPIIAALTVISAYFLAFELSGRFAARMATLLMIASPFVLLIASSHMNHITALFCGLTFALFYIRAHKYGKSRDAICAGLALGFLCITRPQVALPLALPFMFHWVLTTFRSRRALFWRCGMLMSVFCLSWIAFYMYYNYQTTGNPMVTGYQKNGELGLKPLRQLLNGEYHFESSFNRLFHRWVILHKNLLGWPISSLFFVWLLFQFNLFKKYSGLMAASALSISFSIMLTQFNDKTFAPRYLFEAGGICLVLTAVALSRLSTRIAKIKHYPLRLSFTRFSVITMVVALSLWTIPTHTEAKYNFYSSNYMRNRPKVIDVIQNVNKTPALILHDRSSARFAASLFYPVTSNKNIITARSKGIQNKKLLEHYPDYYVFSLKNKKLELIREPVTKSKKRRLR